MSSVCAERARYRRSEPPRLSIRVIVGNLGNLGNLGALVRIWRARRRARRQLVAMGERELQDIGICWPEIADEVGKPFWRE